MAKRKRNLMTSEEQRAFDERTRWIDEQLDRRWREIAERRGVVVDVSSFRSRSKLVDARLVDSAGDGRLRADDEAQAAALARVRLRPVHRVVGLVQEVLGQHRAGGGLAMPMLALCSSSTPGIGTSNDRSCVAIRVTAASVSLGGRSRAPRTRRRRDGRPDARRPPARAGRRRRAAPRRRRGARSGR